MGNGHLFRPNNLLVRMKRICVHLHVRLDQFQVFYSFFIALIFFGAGFKSIKNYEIEINFL